MALTHPSTSGLSPKSRRISSIIFFRHNLPGSCNMKDFRLSRYFFVIAFSTSCSNAFSSAIASIGTPMRSHERIAWLKVSRYWLVSILDTARVETCHTAANASGLIPFNSLSAIILGLPHRLGLILYISAVFYQIHHL